MIKMEIDDKVLELEEKITILQAAASVGIRIPTLCYNKYLKPYGGCRICLVETSLKALPGRSRLVPACDTHIEDGLVVSVNSERAKSARSFIYALMLHRCPNSRELMEFGREHGLGVEKDQPHNVIEEYLFTRTKPLDDTNCILCGLCVRVCAEVTERHAISYAARGVSRKVKTPFEKISERCIGCRSCAYLCPTKTITVEEAT